MQRCVGQRILIAVQRSAVGPRTDDADGCALRGLWLDRRRPQVDDADARKLQRGAALPAQPDRKHATVTRQLELRLRAADGRAVDLDSCTLTVGALVKGFGVASNSVAVPFELRD